MTGVSYVSFDQSADATEWREIADLFAACFAAEPYFEDPDELRTIVDWGPAMLAGNGRLVTARTGDALVGFALGHALSYDASWQRTLAVLDHPAAIVEPGEAFVVHELAVRDDARGRGIARDCLAHLVRDRTESQIFIGTYERAHAARSMYLRWGFEAIGRVPVAHAAIALHVLTCATRDALGRLERH